MREKPIGKNVRRSLGICSKQKAKGRSQAGVMTNMMKVGLVFTSNLEDPGSRSAANVSADIFLRGSTFLLYRVGLGRLRSENG